MPVSSVRRLSRKHLERLHAGRHATDRLLAAIQTLLGAGGGDDPLFLAHGLDLLVANLGADLAYLVSVEGAVHETRWWSPDRGENDPPPVVQPFCRWLVEHPERVMVLRDIPREGRLAAAEERDVQAALGVALWQGGQARSLVFVHFRRPRSFSRVELALFGFITGLMARSLEVEDLKAGLGRLENALAITKAVMEDSSIQDPATDLPNLRYLDIWLKANLGSGRRPEPMAVALFRAPAKTRKDLGRLRLAAEQIRGADLMVAAGEGRFLVLLLGATKGLAHILLMRLRNQLDGVAMGATLWDPDLDDAGLDGARKRAEEALRESAAGEPGSIVWRIPEGHVPPPRPRPAALELDAGPQEPSAPRIWRPKPLSALTEESGAPAPDPRESAIILPSRKKPRERP